MRIAAHTLGCKLNFAETSHLLRRMEREGYEVVDFGEEADVYVVNTCTVTSVAEKKCRTAIRQAVRANPQAVVAVVGCFAQRAAEAIAAIPGVAIVLGNDRKHLLPEILTGKTPLPCHDSTPETPKAFTPCYSGGDRTRTFFKIQDGCDYFCTYCAIPFARGRSRSATIDETLAVAREIAATGTREVVLTGVNTGTFGLHHGERFIDLLRGLDRIEGIVRYRISSIEPNLLNDEIIDFVASSRAFLPHFHIPLQAGSDKVLRLMHRNYDTALYASRLDHIKRLMPHACIAADVITGFNGEDDEAFAEGKAFIDSLPVSYLHIFPYSERPATAALRMPDKVAVAVRRERSAALHELSARKRAAFVESHLGTTRDVLWEHTKIENGKGVCMQGWTDNYIRLQRPFDPALAGTVTPYAVTNSTIVENFSPDD
ncbi:MAG: tRNA (N(6)-L-threonylcarbamoyladenosine(37)-C(2))-methylthiotransferase MtaB [Bacteroidales bacterium]|nr:tRNA (N(6)-L-threonylcarbamoyladenosine(37)-C(2))-methylthiotransferase MtaB [Bacteroidales bacterium]